MELKVSLRREHRTGESPGDHHHQLRAEADLGELHEHELPANGGDEHRLEGVQGQQYHFPKIPEELEEGLSQEPDKS